MPRTNSKKRKKNRGSLNRKSKLSEHIKKEQKQTQKKQKHESEIKKRNKLRRDSYNNTSGSIEYEAENHMANYRFSSDGSDVDSDEWEYSGGKKRNKLTLKFPTTKRAKK